MKQTIFLNLTLLSLVVLLVNARRLLFPNFPDDIPYNQCIKLPKRLNGSKCSDGYVRWLSPIQGKRVKGKSIPFHLEGLLPSYMRGREIEMTFNVTTGMCRKYCWVHYECESMDYSVYPDGSSQCVLNSKSAKEDMINGNATDYLLLFECCEQIERKKKGNETCGLQKIRNLYNNRIAYGDLASPGEFPSMVSVEGLLNSTSGYRCGGVLINLRWILTSATCYSNESSDLSHSVNFRVHVTLGHLDRETNEGTEQTPSVRRIILHPKHTNNSFAYNVALIELWSSVQLNDYVQLACLPDKEEMFEAMDCTAIGYGFTEKGKNSLLRKAILPTMTNAYCDRLLMHHSMTPEQMCAGYVSDTNSNRSVHPNTCYNDNGSPLLCNKPQYLGQDKWIVAGILSAHKGYCSDKKVSPSLYARVTSHLNWIEETIQTYTVYTMKITIKTASVYDAGTDCKVKMYFKFENGESSDWYYPDYLWTNEFERGQTDVFYYKTTKTQGKVEKVYFSCDSVGGECDTAPMWLMEYVRIDFTFANGNVESQKPICLANPEKTWICEWRFFRTTQPTIEFPQGICDESYVSTDVTFDKCMQLPKRASEAKCSNGYVKWLTPLQGKYVKGRGFKGNRKVQITAEYFTDDLLLFNVTIGQCVSYCWIHSKCESFNFKVLTPDRRGNCYLNANSTEQDIVNDPKESLIRYECCSERQITENKNGSKSQTPEKPTYERQSKTCGRRNIKNPFQNRLGYATFARPGEFPWTAYLYGAVNSSIVRACGGVLIDERWILTAAHCYYNGSSDIPHDADSRMTIKLGEIDTDVDEGTEQYPSVKKIIPHPHYSTIDYVNDIALIQLLTPVTINEYVDTACLPEEREDFDDMNCSTTGNGQSHNDSSVSKLRKAILPVLTNQDCQSVFWMHNIYPTVICAGFHAWQGVPGKISSICNGDSGSPLLCNKPTPAGRDEWIIAGITSKAGGVCSGRVFPGVFTRVSKYVRWIAETMIKNTEYDLKVTFKTANEDDAGTNCNVKIQFKFANNETTTWYYPDYSWSNEFEKGNTDVFYYKNVENRGKIIKVVVACDTCSFKPEWLFEYIRVDVTYAYQKKESQKPICVTNPKHVWLCSGKEDIHAYDFPHGDCDESGTGIRVTEKPARTDLH